MASEVQSELAQTAAAFLEEFFAVPNRFANPFASCGDTCGPTVEEVPEALVNAIQRMYNGGIDLPVLLPFRSSADDPLTWYACARDKPGERAVRADLDAFIGPGFADFDIAMVARTHADDVFEKHGFHAIRFTAIRASFDKHIAEQWRLYWALLERRPIRRTLEHRTFAQLRAALDWALLAKNEPEARAAVAALREQHGLSAENRAFLEIRIAAAFGRWGEILAQDNFPYLLKLRLPPETFGDVWEALYETWLRPMEQSGDVGHLMAAFEAEVRPAAGHLLRSLGRSRRPAALKCFLLHELSQAQPSVDLCTQWFAKLGDDAFGPATPAIGKLVQKLTPKHGFDAAREDMDLERYEQAYDLLWSLEDSAEVLGALLRCAKEIDDPSRAEQTVERVQASGAAISAAVQETRARLLGDVTRLAATKPPESLEAQLRVEAESEPAAADNVVELWRELASTDALTKIDGAMARRLVQTMEDEVLSNSGTFDALLPVWFSWIVERTKPHAPFIPVYSSLLDTIWVRDRYGESELDLIKQAALHVVMAGPTPDQYVQLMERLLSIFDATRSPRYMPWALDLADALMIAPTRDEQARNRLLVAILSAGSEYSARLADAQKALLLLLASETSIPFTILTPEVSKFDEPETLASEARVMIYSLDSQATQRAMNVLQTVNPKLKVTTNCDTECTPRLRQHARHADYVFFVSSVATHQAFFCIKDALRNPDSLCQVLGTGTTRIVESVMRRVQGLG
ncbi:protein DpdD [Burkholderia cenocepacia]|uniref:protein DpdD n=1 Tax=Burkholderia cenocepacia TaxID=95486 RepID=UPI002ABDC5FB|nr:protein DpdD [Burkholderia cenocepacia]